MALYMRLMMPSWRNSVMQTCEKVHFFKQTVFWDTQHNSNWNLKPEKKVLRLMWLEGAEHQLVPWVLFHYVQTPYSMCRSLKLQFMQTQLLWKISHPKVSILVFHPMPRMFSKHSVLVPFGFQWAFAKDDAAGSGSQKKLKNSDTFTSRSPCFARVRLEAKKIKYVFASISKAL